MVVITYRRLSYEERVKISTYLQEKRSLAWIARKLGRATSSISREIRRFDSGYEEYHPLFNQVESRYTASGRRRGTGKIHSNLALRKEVLQGLRKRWSPEQISNFLKNRYPKDPSMQVSHETIYTYIYVLPRGELRKELSSYLRQKQKLRGSRGGSHRKRGRIPEMISIEERPKSVERRALAGHWEGDLLIGPNHRTALGTLVERKTRTVLLVPLRKKTATAVRRAFERAVRTLPKQMRGTLTYDQGLEMAQHRLFSKNTKMKVYFCHPASPWERGTCENTNGLIRDYFPKNTDFSKVSKARIKRVQDELNERPRKTLGFRTPKEVFTQEILKPLR